MPSEKNFCQCHKEQMRIYVRTWTRAKHSSKFKYRSIKCRNKYGDMYTRTADLGRYHIFTHENMFVQHGYHRVRSCTCNRHKLWG